MTTYRSISIIGLLPGPPSTADVQKFFSLPAQHGFIPGVWGTAVFPLANASQIVTALGPNEVARRAVDNAGTYSLVFNGHSIDLRIQGAFGFIEGTFTSPDVAAVDPLNTKLGTVFWPNNAGAGNQTYFGSAAGQVSFTNADGTFQSAIKPFQIMLTTFDI